jgi:lipoprotein-releasing system ATP-binding protein
MNDARAPASMSGEGPPRPASSAPSGGSAPAKPQASGDQHPPVVACRNLSRTYRNGPLDVPVLLGIDLDVGMSERVAIVGASGSGKSTLLHLLGGLDLPSGGEVRVEGVPLATLSEAARGTLRNRALGFIYQFHHLLPEFTALENAAMPLVIRGESQTAAKARALQLLDGVGLKDRANHRAGELSGGEMQRVALARALSGNPSVLLADEPTGNLDPSTGEKIFGLLQDLHRNHALTSVIVTHNPAFAARCDRALRIGAGGLIRA